MSTDSFINDLELRKIENSLKESNLEIIAIDELEDFKNETIQNLYLKDFEKAISSSSEIIKKYDLSEEEYYSYNLFFKEVLSFENFDEKSFSDKKQIFKSLYSPELILFSYLTFSNSEQNEIVLNKDSVVILDIPLIGANLIYKDHLDSGLYSEMAINDVFFVVPDTIEGKKIFFEMSGDNYYLHYVRYSDTQSIDVILIENLSNGLNQNTFSNYY